MKWNNAISIKPIPPDPRTWHVGLSECYCYYLCTQYHLNICLVFWLPYFFFQIRMVYLSCLCIDLKHKCSFFAVALFLFINFILFLFFSFYLLSFLPVSSLPPFFPSLSLPSVYIALLCRPTMTRGHF